MEYCLEELNQLKKRDDKSEKARELVNRRWNKKKVSADSPQKDNESRSSNKDSLKEHLEEFDKFWSIYDKKVGKDKTFTLWGKLTERILKHSSETRVGMMR